MQFSDQFIGLCMRVCVCLWAYLYTARSRRK